MTADFPFARSLNVVRSQRTIKKTGQSSTESRYYLSSRAPGDHRAEQWLGFHPTPGGILETQTDLIRKRQIADLLP